MMYRRTLKLFPCDHGYGGLINDCSHAGDQQYRNMVHWWQWQQSCELSRYKAAERRFKREWLDKHTNTPPLLPAPRAEAHKPKLLDLFCGAGGAGYGYKLAGFHVTGVDIAPQPRYAGDVFIQADALEYLCKHWQEYDFIHASPPCQRYSITRNIHRDKPDDDYADLLPVTRILLKFIGKPYVIENVPTAPMELDAIKLNGLMFPELRVIRNRLFESNMAITTLPQSPKRGTTSGNGKGYSTFDDGYYITVAGHNFRHRDGCIAMGINWMNQHELAESIPPAYTQHIGNQLLSGWHKPKQLQLLPVGEYVPGYHPKRIA